MRGRWFIRMGCSLGRVEEKVRGCLCRGGVRLLMLERRY